MFRKKIINLGNLYAAYGIMAKHAFNDYLLEIWNLNRRDIMFNSEVGQSLDINRAIDTNWFKDTDWFRYKLGG